MVTLGFAAPVPTFGDGGRPVAALNGPANETSPTLTEDLLDIFFISDRAEGLGAGDVWHATRASRADAFGEPSLVVEASSDAAETSAAVALDGLTLWIGAERAGGAGGSDVWMLQRTGRAEPWGPAVNVGELNGPRADVPRPTARGGLVMPVASEDEAGSFQTVLAERSSAEGPFERFEPLDELYRDGSSVEDVFLTDDGRLAFFVQRSGANDGELVLSWRSAEGAPFGDPVPLAAVNTEGDERSPWLSPDGTRFFFATARRDGRQLDIYATTLELPRFE